MRFLPFVVALALAGCFGDSGSNGGSATSSSTGDGPDPNLGAIRLVEIATGFSQPLLALPLPGSDGDLLVVEQAGKIRWVRDVVVETTPLLDITDRVGSAGSEQGLLGLALHPAFAANGVAILSYTNLDGDSIISRFKADTDHRFDPASEEILLILDQPFENHNGGHIVYGPDGYLYVGFGDGGLAGDPNLNGQRKETLLGDMLRLDVGVSGAYTIPPDNPYVSSPTFRPEIWASGLRNPWRFHFDPENGDLWIGDVGQDMFEEINHQPAGVGGRNYGWNIYEGNHHYPVDATAPSVTADTGFTFPAAEYSHALGCSITGGPVYRGSALPELVGATLYGDYCTGTIWRLDGPSDEPEVLLESGGTISSFGVDEEGEILVLDYAAGRLLRMML